MAQRRVTLADVETTFENVDLDLKSAVDPAHLLREFGNRVLSLHADRIGRRHWLRLMLARQPKNPTDAILGFAKLVAKLSPHGRTIWARATKEFDIGFQGGLHPSSAEWVVSDKAVRAAASCGAAIRVTLYSPQLVVDAETSKRTRLPRRRDS